MPHTPEPPPEPLPGPQPSDDELTELINGWQAGESGLADRAMSSVYRKLRRIARRLVWDENRDATLGPTAVVHELYLRLEKATGPRFENRAHFFALAARVMRQALVDHCRANARIKRGGAYCRISLEELGEAATASRPEILVALGDALRDLQRRSPRLAATVDLRFFGGLTIEETAACLGVAPKTVSREWQRAKVWLYRALTRDEPEGSETV